eukprot:358432-Chlamydomonas_euryale.AAC.2
MPTRRTRSSSTSGKAAAEAAAAAAAAAAVAASNAGGGDMTDLERLRKERMATNAAKLQQLGVRPPHATSMNVARVPTTPFAPRKDS